MCIRDRINIGIVEGGYEYDRESYYYRHRRKVKWLKHIPRTSFSQGALYEAGATLSFFQIKNYAEEYLNALEKGFKSNMAVSYTHLKIL